MKRLGKSHPLGKTRRAIAANNNKDIKIAAHSVIAATITVFVATWMLSKGMGQPFWQVQASWLWPFVFSLVLAGIGVASAYAYGLAKGQLRRAGMYGLLYTGLLLLTLYLASCAYMWFISKPIHDASAFMVLWLFDFAPILFWLQVKLLLAVAIFTLLLPTIIIVYSLYTVGNRKGTHFQSLREMRRNQLLENKSTDLYFGKAQREWVSHETVALTVIAAARSGKSRSIIVPNAKMREGSAIFNDNRGELYPILKPGYEEKGYAVYRWSPFNPDGSDSINPLLMIRFTPDHMIDDLDVIVDMIVPENSGTTSSEDFFRTVSCDLIRALIIYRYIKVGKDADELTMQHVIEQGTTNKIERLLKEILADAESQPAYIRIALQMFVRKIVEAEDPKSKSNAMLSAQVHLSKLYSPKILKTLSGHDIDINAIRHNKVAIFIEIPKGKKEKMKNYLALFYQLLITSVTEEGDFDVKKHQRITCYLDEFGNMAKIPALPEASTELGAFGLCFIFILQNMGQARNVYGDTMAETIFGAGAMMIGSTNSLPDTKYFSEAMGKYEKKIKIGKGKETQTTTREVDLMTHDAIRTMKKKYWLVLLEGQYPIKLRKGFYFLDKALRSATIAETRKYKFSKWLLANVIIIGYKLRLGRIKID